MKHLTIVQLLMSPKIIRSRKSPPTLKARMLFNPTMTHYMVLEVKIAREALATQSTKVS